MIMGRVAVDSEAPAFGDAGAGETGTALQQPVPLENAPAYLSEPVMRLKMVLT